MTDLGLFTKRKGRAPLHPLVGGLFTEDRLSGLDDAAEDAITQSLLGGQDEDPTPATPTTERNQLQPINAQDYLRRRGVSSPGEINQSLSSDKSKRKKILQQRTAGSLIGMLLSGALGRDTRQKIDVMSPTIQTLARSFGQEQQEDKASSGVAQQRLAAFYKALTDVEDVNQRREELNFRYGQEKPEKHTTDWSDEGQIVGEDGFVYLKKINKHSGERVIEPFEIGGKHVKKGADEFTAYQKWRMGESDEKDKRVALKDMEALKRKGEKVNQMMAELDALDVNRLAEMAQRPEYEGVLSPAMVAMLQAKNKEGVRESLQYQTKEIGKGMKQIQELHGWSVTFDEYGNPTADQGGKSKEKPKWKAGKKKKW